MKVWFGYGQRLRAMESRNVRLLRRGEAACSAGDIAPASKLRIRCLASHSDDAQSFSVSIETPVIHDLRIMATHRFSNQKRTQLQR